MIKHWPGGGPEEGGRDAHYAYGKFAVYPGNNLDEQLVPFVNGALNLSGKTKTAAAVMPYYTISFNQDQKNFENVGNGYSRYLITDLLRGKYHYDGVVCTDWLVTADEGKTPDIFAGKSWGMETKSIAERHYKVMMAGARPVRRKQCGRTGNRSISNGSEGTWGKIYACDGLNNQRSGYCEIFFAWVYLKILTWILGNPKIP